MKIAIVYRGQLRCGPEHNLTEFLSERVNNIKNSFKDHEIDTYIHTWNDEKFKSIRLENIIDNVIAIKPLGSDKAGKILKGKTALNYQNYPGTWAIFLGTYSILSYIKNSGREYDYVFLTRPDVNVEIDFNLWFSNDENLYTMQDCEKYPINDQCGAGKQEAVFRTWNYESIENLTTILSNSSSNEHALLSIMQKNSIRYEFKPCIRYEFSWQGVPQYRKGF